MTDNQTRYEITVCNGSKLVSLTLFGTDPTDGWQAEVLKPDGVRLIFVNGMPVSVFQDGKELWNKHRIFGVGDLKRKRQAIKAWETHALGHSVSVKII